MGGKRDNREGGVNREHLFPRILGYERSHNKEVDIIEFRVWLCIGDLLHAKKIKQKERETRERGSFHMCTMRSPSIRRPCCSDSPTLATVFHFSSIYVCVVVTNLFWRSHFLDSTHCGQLSIWGLHNFVSNLDSIIVLGSASIMGIMEKKKRKGSEVNPVTMVAQVQICDLKIALKMQRRELSSS